MCETPVTKTKTVKIFFRTVNDSNWLDLPGLCNINSKFSQNSAKIQPKFQFKISQESKRPWIFNILKG